MNYLDEYRYLCCFGHIIFGRSSLLGYMSNLYIFFLIPDSIIEVTEIFYVGGGDIINFSK